MTMVAVNYHLLLLSHKMAIWSPWNKISILYYSYHVPIIKFMLLKFFIKLFPNNDVDDDEEEAKLPK
jgi:hypothetical protein